MLKLAGTERRRVLYSGRGVRSPMFGVSLDQVMGMARSVGMDPRPARDLWRSGNHDARVLATLVADPSSSTEAELAAWAADCDDHVIAGLLAAFIARTDHARRLSDQCREHPDDIQAQLGWMLVTHLAQGGCRADRPAVVDDWLGGRLDEISLGFRSRGRRTRAAMSEALVAFGREGEGLRQRAEAIADGRGARASGDGLGQAGSPGDRLRMSMQLGARHAARLALERARSSVAQAS